ncbi:amidohydrolase [Puteibacter caeruleilacunae]|nr:amidohydrolase [Puteibacter caeruleilacunae]
MKNSLTFALVQVDLAWEKKDQNLKHIEELMKDHIKNADVIALPEMFSTGFSMASSTLAESMSGPTIAWMAKQASTYDALICGSLIVKENDDYYNRMVWVYPTGEMGCYDKRHLFRMGNENQHFSSGNKRKVISWRGWRICPQICYDLRFPVWSRNRNDYDVLMYSANWPASRDDVWSTLLKARALENQSYVVGVNRIGCDQMGVDYVGDSLIFDFKGARLNSDSLNDEIVQEVTFCKEDLEDFRAKFPVLKDADDFEIQM